MTTRLLDLGLSKPVAAGLDWEAVELPQAKASVKGVRGKAYALIASVDTNEVAIGGDPANVASPGKHLCGAALIAAYAQSAFVYHSIGVQEGGEELVWICGVQHGIPVPGFEAVLPVGEARQKYSEFASYADNPLLIGSLDEAKLSLQDVVDKLDGKAVKAASLKATGIQLGQALLALLLFAITVAMFLFYQHLEEQRKREQLQWEQMLKRQAATEAERKRLENLRLEFERKVAAKREELAAQRDPARAVENWLQFLANEVPVSHQGWVPLRASCRVDGCMVFWRPGQTALPIDGRRLPGTLQTWAANEVSTRFAMEGVARQPRVGADSEFQYRLLSFSGATSGQAQVMSAPDPTPVVLTPPAELKELQPVNLGTVGTFKATFTNLLAVREFLNVVRPYAVEIDHFEATAFAPNVGTPGWSLEGRYIVRN